MNSNEEDTYDSDIEYIGTKTARGSSLDEDADVHQVNRTMSRMTVSPAPISKATPNAPVRKRKMEPDAGEGRGRKSKAGRSVRLLGDPYAVVKGLVVTRDGAREKGEEARYTSIQIGEQIIEVSQSHRPKDTAGRGRLGIK